jgi:hypothetical protein
LDCSSLPGVTTLAISNTPSVDQIIFKHDRLYRHNIMRINYTTYDVRRKQDVFNPKTPHRDIMVLANTDDGSLHPFIYARILGIYHVNIVYTGPGMVDYRPERYDFLWVRWFGPDADAPAGNWSHFTLDRISFPPMANEDAFGFIDPADVVRGCHIIPAFAKKKHYVDEQGLSRCAMDSGDWRSYHVNRCVLIPYLCATYLTATRFVDRDMLMRFHWGLAVGHVYTHDTRVSDPSVVWTSNGELPEADDPPQDDPPSNDSNPPPCTDSSIDRRQGGNDEDSACEGDGHDSGDGEEPDLPVGGLGSDSENSERQEGEEDLLAFDEMYGDGAVASDYDD